MEENNTWSNFHILCIQRKSKADRNQCISSSVFPVAFLTDLNKIYDEIVCFNYSNVTWKTASQGLFFMCIMIFTDLHIKLSLI